MVKYAPNNRRQTYRAAVVVGKKVSGSAVVRNRIRRRIYEIIREQMPAGAPAVDFIFTVFEAKAATVPAEELKSAIKNLLKSAGLPVG